MRGRQLGTEPDIGLGMLLPGTEEQGQGQEQEQVQVQRLGIAVQRCTSCSSYLGTVVRRKCCKSQDMLEHS